jgi:very-short-patch-repair endonuclease
MRDRQDIDPAFRRVLRDRSREMRKKMPPAEAILWARLRGDRIGGFRFRRQHPIGIYIADFFCSRKNLVIEVDGDSHFRGPEEEQWDKDRMQHFLSIGLREIRFTNQEVLKNVDGVVNTIAHELGVM